MSQFAANEDGRRARGARVAGSLRFAFALTPGVWTPGFPVVCLLMKMLLHRVVGRLGAAMMTLLLAA